MGRAATRRKKAVPMCHSLTQAERAWVCASIANDLRKTAAPALMQAWWVAIAAERDEWTQEAWTIRHRQACAEIPHALWFESEVQSPIIDALDAMGAGEHQDYGSPARDVLSLYSRQVREWEEPERPDWEAARDTAYAMLRVLCPEAAELLAAISEETTEQEIAEALDNRGRPTARTPVVETLRDA